MSQNIAKMSLEEVEAAYVEACRNLSSMQITQIETRNTHMCNQFPKMRYAQALFDRIETLKESGKNVA